MPILTNQATVAYKSGTQNFSSLSNQTLFNLLSASLTAIKTQIPSAGVSGDIVAFTVILTNTDIALSITNVVLTDNLTAAGYTYVVGTAQINGVATADSPQTGINIGTMLPLGIKTVTFNATVN